MAHFPPLLTLPKIQNDVSVWSKIESSAQPKIIWQFLFTKSTELIRRVSFTKQPSLINNKPVHFVFYRDIHTYARFYPKSYRRQGSTDQNCWLTGKVYVPVYDHGWKYIIILRDVYDLLKYTILRFWNYTIFLLKIYDHYFTPKWSYTLHPSDRIPR